MPSAYETELEAARGLFSARRSAAKREITQTDLDNWGLAAEAGGAYLSNVGQERLARVRAEAEGFAKEQIGAEERAYLANIKRLEEAKRKQSTRNALTAVGSLAGLLVPGAGVAGAAIGGGLGGMLGGLVTGEFEGNIPATFVSGLSAIESARRWKAMREDFDAWLMGAGAAGGYTPGTEITDPMSNVG